MKFLEFKQVINKSGKFTKANGFTISDENQVADCYADFNILVRCESNKHTSYVNVEICINSFSNNKVKTHYYKGKVRSNMRIFEDCLAARDILNAMSEKVGLGKYNYKYDLHYHI